jgi:ribosomal protein L7/L12
MSKHISAKTVLRAAEAVGGMDADGKEDVLLLVLGEHPKAVIDALKRLGVIDELEVVEEPAPLPLEPAEAPPDTEQLYKVVISSAPRKISLIRWIREITGAGLKEAKDMVELTYASAYPYKVGEEAFRAWARPGVLASGLTRAEAAKLARFFLQVSVSATARYNEPPIETAGMPEDAPYQFYEPPYSTVGLSDKF